MATSVSSAATGTSTIDVQGIVSQLMTIERQPVNKLNTNITSVQSKITAYGTLKASLSALQTAAQALARSQNTTSIGLKSTSSDATSASATATAGAATAPHTIVINRLANSQKVLTTGFDSLTAKIGDGKLTISPGTFSETGVFSDATASNPVIVDLTGLNLPEAAEKINASSSNILASPVYDGSKWRMTFTSKDTGSTGGFSLKSDPTSGSGNPLNVSFGADQTGTATGTGLRVSLAQDSSFTLDGMKMTRPTNRIDDAIPGVSIQIGKVSPEPVTITVTRDPAALKTAMDSFITAYNNLNSTARNLSPTTVGLSGPLRGDATVASTVSAIRSAVMANVGSSTIGSLSGLGVSFQLGGNLSLDAAKFSAASADSTQFSNLMAGTSGEGIASGVSAKITNFLSVEGSIFSRTTGLQNTVKSMKNKIASLENRMTSIQKKYTQQYTQLDSQIANMQNLSSSLSRTLG